MGDPDHGGSKAVDEQGPPATLDAEREPGAPDAVAEAVPSARSLVHLIGTTIARKYRIDEVIGAGGMGTVFRARHLLLKRDVALKVLHPDLNLNEEIRERFDREAQSAARLEHPNIVHVSEYGSTDAGMKFMVMQLLEGHELIEELGKKLDPRRVLKLSQQLFAGLEHAHHNGVIHRDLKPENVYVTRDHEEAEVIKLVDFGIAKLILTDDDTRAPERPLTQLGLVFGTPHYMSPEQATGAEIDPRSDLYSAGVLMYEMLAGRPPFDHSDPVALVRMQVSTDPPPFDSDVPRDIAAIVLRLLEKTRDARYADASEVRAALDRSASRLSQGIDPQTIPMPVRAPGTKEPGSPKWIPLAAGTVGLAALGIAAFVAFGRDQTPAPPAATIAAPVDLGDIPHELSADALAEIDKEVLSKRSESALDLIKPMLDEYPNHPTLLWRQGRALAQMKTKRGLALTSYSAALEEDPGLIEDHDFYAELTGLLGDRKLRDQALDIAVQKMGDAGHKFLLQLVNEQEPRKSLDYADRHRALDALADDPDNRALVDRPLNLARDLWQSSRGASPHPCVDFGNALTEISVAANTFYGPGLRRAKVPKDDDAPETCDGLEERLEAVRATVAELEATAAGDTESDTEADTGADTDADTDADTGDRQSEAPSN